MRRWNSATGALSCFIESQTARRPSVWSASQQRRAEEEAPRRSDFTCTRAHPSLRQTDVASIEEEVEEESPDSFERAERPPRLKRTIGARRAPFDQVADACQL